MDASKIKSAIEVYNSSRKSDPSEDKYKAFNRCCDYFKLNKTEREYLANFLRLENSNV